MADSIGEKDKSEHANSIRNDEPSRMDISLFSISRSTIRGLEKIAASPKTRSTLVIFEPTTLPVTTPEVFSCTAIMEVTNSGREVPNASIVAPTKNEEIPRALPTFSEELMNKLEAVISATKLPTNMRMFDIKFLGLYPTMSTNPAQYISFFLAIASIKTASQ